MGILDLLKKDENVPPAVGEEDLGKKKNLTEPTPEELEDDSFSGESENSEEQFSEEENNISEKKGNSVKFDKKGLLDKLKSRANISRANNANRIGEQANSSLSGSIPASKTDFTFERINLRMEELMLRINQVNERLGNVNESIGELRAMNRTNEKNILSSMKEASKVIDMFKEVKPDQLRIDYQHLDMRMKKMEDKDFTNKEMIESILKEFEDFKKKSEIFAATDEILKLNENIKSDLLNTQRLSEKTKMYSDKAKEVFMEIKSGFADSQKLSENVSNLNEAVSSLREQMENTKLSYETVVKRSDYDDFKKTFNTKLAVLNSLPPKIDEIKGETKDIGEIVETLVSVSERNQEDIGSLGLKIGDSNVKRINDYENQISDILEVIEALGNQIFELKKKIESKSLGIHKETKKEEKKEKSIHAKEKTLKKKSAQKNNHHKKNSKGVKHASKLISKNNSAGKISKLARNSKQHVENPAVKKKISPEIQKPEEDIQQNTEANLTEVASTPQQTEEQPNEETALESVADANLPTELDRVEKLDAIEPEESKLSNLKNRVLGLFKS